MLEKIWQQWIPLEDVHYKLTEFGNNFEFEKVKPGKKWPDFENFHIAIAKNGGPIAFMCKDSIEITDKNLKDIMSLVFIFSSFGKLISIINILEIFKKKK